MNILFLQAANTIGGAELSLLEQIKFLQPKGIRCFIILAPSAGNDLGKLMEAIGVKIFFLKLPPNNSLSRLKGWRKVVNYCYRRYKNNGIDYCLKRIEKIILEYRIDIIHTNTVHTSIGKLAGESFGVPHVQHLREITGFSSESIIQLKGQQNAEKFKKKWGTHNGLIANSNYCLDRNRPWFEGKKKLVLYNTVAPQPSLKKRVDSTPIIGLVANVTSRIKRHYHFLKIAAAYTAKYDEPIAFHIYGKLPADKSDSYFNGLQEEVKQLGIEAKLKFRGTVPSAEIYSEITCLVHTYPYESFGRIFIEAMAAGVPVLTWKGGGASELIQHGYNGFLFEEGDYHSIASTINNLLDNKELYQRITENGKTKAKEFTPDIVFRDLPDFYASLIKKN